MESICSVDKQFAIEIAALLKTPATHHAQDYFDDLIAKKECSTRLKVIVDGQFGKGLYADTDFKEAELVLKDQMLLGSQHPSNKMDCFVCSCCFRFLGSIELQIGRKLYLQSLGLCSGVQCNSDSSDGDDSCVPEDANLGECSTSASKATISLPEEVIESLTNGQMLLPYSEKFALPSECPCPGGCGEEFYCSEMCAARDWETCHSLLCTGEKSKASRPEALSKFLEHANNTNDIFILAAKAISMTLLKYKFLKKAHLREVGYITSNATTIDLSLLQKAWKPFSMGYKRRWWDCIALPEDVDKSDEVAFRRQIKEMAFESLQLLKEAIFDVDCAPLFSLEIYGHIIGMFELNNLDLVVASPVEEYFLYIDDLPGTEKKKAEAVTRPILNALGDDYSICCQGQGWAGNDRGSA